MRKRLVLCTLGTISIGFAMSGPARAAEFVGDAPSSGFVQAASGPRSSPFEPPRESDISFVTDSAPKLDTGCTFSAQGPLVFDVEITRHAGELNPDGTLKHAAELVRDGLLSPRATLIIPTFDVDDKTVPPPPLLPEIDRVYFNGEPIGVLSGLNNTWKLNSFQVDITKVKFAQRGSGGSRPEGAANQIRIDIDTGNAPTQVWCTSADWAAASFKAMSPIILIHGNSSDGKFFERRGFTRGLEDWGLVYDDRIDLDNDTIHANGTILSYKIHDRVLELGVDSVHLVMHSKGGLDTRVYLADVYKESNFKILSYTSLSTPHDGSIAADVQHLYERAVDTAARVKFWNFPSFGGTVTRNVLANEGTVSLTTFFAASFNRHNLPRLPTSIVYNTVAADADLNGNEMMDRVPPYDEYLELREEDPALQKIDDFAGGFFGQAASERLVNAVYQILRGVGAVKLTYSTEKGWFGKERTVATLTAVDAGPFENDVAVPVHSGEGRASLFPRVQNRWSFTGSLGRNHSNVADAGVAGVVAHWIIQIEKSKGDLQ